MPDYQQGKIYKLWSPQGTEDEIYYGSTTDELRFRKSNHKKKNNVCQSKQLFQKYDDVRIELVEEYPCNSKAELVKKEGEYIRNNKCLNKYIPDRTIKEWRENNKTHLKEYTKEWREINKTHLKEYKKKYRENNKEIIVESEKEYYENNKQSILEYHKNYHENNKDKINEYQKEYREKNNLKQKITCECGCFISLTNLARHQKTKIHIKLMEEKKENNI